MIRSQNDKDVWTSGERRRQRGQSGRASRQNAPATASRTYAGAIRTHSGDTALLEFMSFHPCRMMSLLVGIASDEGARERRLWMTSDALFCRGRDTRPKRSKSSFWSDWYVVFKGCSTEVSQGWEAVGGVKGMKGWKEGEKVKDWPLRIWAMKAPFHWSDITKPKQGIRKMAKIRHWNPDCLQGLPFYCYHLLKIVCCPTGRTSLQDIVRLEAEWSYTQQLWTISCPPARYHQESDVYSLLYSTDPSYIIYDGAYVRYDPPPHGTSYQCSYDILCLLWHQICARLLFYYSVFFILLLCPLSSSAHHAAVQQKQHGYSISLNSHGRLNDGERIGSCQWRSGFKVDVEEYKWAAQWLPLAPGAFLSGCVVSFCLCGTLTSSHGPKNKLPGVSWKVKFGLTLGEPRSLVHSAF